MVDRDAISRMLLPARTAVIVVDVENGFTSDDSTLAKRGASMVLARACVPQINELIRAAHEASVHVVYLQSVHNRRISLPNKFALRGDWEQLPIHDFSWETEFYPGLEQPSEQDMVIKKYNYDGFSDTALHLHLRSMGIETAVFCGIETCACVETTARHAYILGYNVVVAADACACCGTSVQESQELHEASLRVLRGRFGTVLSVAELAGAWSAGRVPQPLA